MDERRGTRLRGAFHSPTRAGVCTAPPLATPGGRFRECGTRVEPRLLSAGDAAADCPQSRTAGRPPARGPAVRGGRACNGRNKEPGIGARLPPLAVWRVSGVLGPSGRQPRRNINTASTRRDSLPVEGCRAWRRCWRRTSRRPAPLSPACRRCPGLELPAAISSSTSRSRGVSVSSGSSLRRLDRSVDTMIGSSAEPALHDPPHRGHELPDPADAVLQQIAHALGGVGEQLQSQAQLDVLRQHQHPFEGWRARISRAARRPSSLCVGGSRMSTIATSSGSCPP
jgi:hypothetical protein